MMYVANTSAHIYLPPIPDKHYGQMKANKIVVQDEPPSFSEIKTDVHQHRIILC